MLKICICDDSSKDLKTLQKYTAAFTQEHPEFTLKATAFLSPYDLLESINEHGGYDLYLLDIIMPHLNGIDIARILRDRAEPAEIIFLTSSREYAVEAFGVKAAGYLLKPVAKADFDQEILNCIHRLSPQDNPAILLKTKKGVRKVSLQELVMVESFNHLRICTLADGTTLETPETLTSLYEQLQRYPCFFLPHRAYIVNMDYINGLTTTELILVDGRQIPISRNIYPKFKTAYLRYTL